MCMCDGRSQGRNFPSRIETAWYTDPPSGTLLSQGRNFPSRIETAFLTYVPPHQGSQGRNFPSRIETGVQAQPSSGECRRRAGTFRGGRSQYRPPQFRFTACCLRAALFFRSFDFSLSGPKDAQSFFHAVGGLFPEASCFPEAASRKQSAWPGGGSAGDRSGRGRDEEGCDAVGDTPRSTLAPGGVRDPGGVVRVAHVGAFDERLGHP